MKKPKNFEESLAALEELVGKLESGELSLDDSLAAFEEAIALARACNDQLAAAEQKVRLLTEDAEGNGASSPFDPMKQSDAT